MGHVFSPKHAEETKSDEQGDPREKGIGERAGFGGHPELTGGQLALVHTAPQVLSEAKAQILLQPWSYADPAARRSP